MWWKWIEEGLVMDYYEIAHGWRDMITGEIIEEWYSPAEILFKRPHMIWLLTYLEILEGGEWIPLPRDDEYRNHSLHPNAYFATPGLMASEVNYRLDQTDDGAIVKLYYKANITIYDVAKIGHISHDQAFYSIRSHVNYISGFRRRKETYLEFIKRGHDRRMVHSRS